MTKYLTNREAAQAMLDGVELLYCGKLSTGANIRMDALDDLSEYTLAPQTITRTITYPAPETVAPENGTRYWVPAAPQHSDFCAAHIWVGDTYDFRALDRGLVYDNQDDAIARAKEMLK